MQHSISSIGQLKHKFRVQQQTEIRRARESFCTSYPHIHRFVHNRDDIIDFLVQIQDEYNYPPTLTLRQKQTLRETVVDFLENKQVPFPVQQHILDFLHSREALD